MRIALDTNVLAYAEGVNDAERRDRANQVIAALHALDLFLPSQVAGELFNVLTRKDRRSPAEAFAAVDEWMQALNLATYTPAALTAAFQLARDHDVQIWDALIVCTAAEAECDLLLSEDMQDGFVYRGVTVADPFAERMHPLLASLLDTLPGAPA